MVQLTLLLLCAALPVTPLDLGKREIASVAGARAGDVRLEVKPGGPKESFRISGDGIKVVVTGADENGAMYGAFEFAERLHQTGDRAWSTKFEDKPFLPDRGLNLFLTLPWNYAKNNTDYEIAALTDPNRWWFANEDYWRTLLDLMAKSRLNWLDIHGGWDISVTNAPNLYAYFVTSPSFPKVGVPDEVKAADLKQLNHVIEMAHERGIRVSLMCYEANLKIPQNPNPPYEGTEANIYKYTKEVVEQMIRKAPGLDAIGFRIGESGHGESFFKCYGEAVKASGRDIPLVTRSWVTKKQNVLPLARASKDFTVEIKYNGEQWGAPYIVAGGRMASWGSYSFEDYLSDSDGREGNGVGRSALGVRNSQSSSGAGFSNYRENSDQSGTPNAERRGPLDKPQATSHVWEGWPAEGGGNWPSEPYKIVWQVRANGTNRIFPFYNPDWVRRSIKAMKMGTASGYTIEGEDAYYPKSPDYYLANPQDKFCDWIHQRDEMYWTTWGRLGYDPNTPDSTFDGRVADWFGGAGAAIARIWKEASQIVPLSYMAHSLGPDHRDDAPELETGGDLDTFVEGEPFDPFVFQPINGLHANDGRIPLSRLADMLASYRSDIRASLDSIADASIPVAQLKRFHEIRTACRQLSSLAGYYGGMFEAATDEFTVHSQAGHMGQAVDAWKEYAGSNDANYYRPFTERLRMHTNTFHWNQELKKIVGELPGIQHASEMLPLPEPTGGSPPPSSHGVALRWRSTGGEIECSVPAGGLDGGSLLYKPLPSSTFFHMKPMVKRGGEYVATLPRERFGYCIAAEIAVGGQKVRIPSFLDGEQPYEVVPSLPGPTPQIYSTNEAMTYLDPRVLTPEKYGTLLVAPRGWTFFRGFNRATKRKLLDPVERGMTLIVLQQDFVSGRYPLDFLPKRISVAPASDHGTFDPGGVLGMSPIKTSDILWQRFEPSEGWDVYGNGGIAHMSYGKGNIWLLSARLMQRMSNPEAALDLRQVLLANGTNKPVVLLDPGTEGAVFTSSLYPDLMNSLGIPFLTLGEVIAQEQGMNSFTVITGPTLNDDVLGGAGPAMAGKFVRNQVIALSKRPTPPTIEAFERVRVQRKKELMKSLGLDPMPPRTPLNARIVGTIQRNGYHIEKLVFESRPRFFVTCHVYVPDHVSTPQHPNALSNTLTPQYPNTPSAVQGLNASTPQGLNALNTPTSPHLNTLLPTPQGRYPVIVVVNGHWAHKKDEDRVQLCAAFQATQGYVAIAIDSPGWSFEGDSLIERRAEGAHDDFELVEGGTNTTGYYVWDTMRALDYMATRPDTDMEHIGITGASGGGLATLYAFAADDRFKAAVPVVYMASMELAPDNGCPCNHVPGTCQIGDRSDVIAIQAPKPVYLMGAQNDGEFPPTPTRLTHEKMQETWKLFGKDQDVYVQIFAGGHDYNQPMREASIGFFNRYLKGQGDGSPVAQPPLQALDSEDHQLLVLDPPTANERTMRDLSKEYLAQAPVDVPAEQAIAINGGRPARSPLNYKEVGTGSTRFVTFDSEPGLVTPGVLVMPTGQIKGVRIHLSDAGKAAEIEGERNKFRGPSSDGFADLYIDALGTGELSGIEVRYTVYAGRAVAFTAGLQAVRAAEAMRKYSTHIEITGQGPMSSQAAMYAGLLAPSFDKVTGTDCLATWSDVFGEGIDPIAIQPRAHLCGSLENLRKQVKNGEWKLR